MKRGCVGESLEIALSLSALVYTNIPTSQYQLQLTLSALFTLVFILQCKESVMVINGVFNVDLDCVKLYCEDIY